MILKIGQNNSNGYPKILRVNESILKEENDMVGANKELKAEEEIRIATMENEIKSLREDLNAMRIFLNQVQAACIRLIKQDKKNFKYAREEKLLRDYILALLKYINCSENDFIAFVECSEKKEKVLKATDFYYNRNMEMIECLEDRFQELMIGSVEYYKSLDADSVHPRGSLLKVPLKFDELTVMDLLSMPIKEIRKLMIEISKNGDMIHDMGR